MLFVQLVWLPILTVVTLFMWDCSSIGQCNAFARQKLRVQAPSIPTRPMIGLWVKCSRSHPFFIMFFFLFYVTSLNCILILLDNVFGLFKIFFYLFIYFSFFFSHRLAWFHCYIVMSIHFYCFVGMTMDFMFSCTWLCT